ncbi:GntR family transcriptional regulator [Mycobacterium sp. 236(2023)]|uniref:GntR family transcriptional regulator n=1 Tax=Mycobacterium sp. 236(2023) TaxID=3038163 RepID=UPI00241500AE|nr:GntR family transcriptional regulator [Mycobacterium sp. 236(2023)]MDG4663764.1 GntR family transcriptional regulator [Mycobacterium sp. 236(2023)]
MAGADRDIYDAESNLSCRSPGELMPIELNRSGKERQTAHEFVREALRRAIFRGELAAGEHLIQAEVASQLSVSVTPVREAMRDLATEGLIVLDSHRGGIVRGTSREDLEEILRIREKLEPMAVDLSVRNVTDNELDRADQLAELMVGESDLGAWVELNRRFHCLLHDAMRSRHLTAIFNRLEDAAALCTAQSQRIEPSIRRRANDDHIDLLRAYRQRDADAALAIQIPHTALSLGSLPSASSTI